MMTYDIYSQNRVAATNYFQIILIKKYDVKLKSFLDDL